MPIYEFKCKNCSGCFEVLTSLSKVSETKCPQCESQDLARLMSMFSAKISGGGSSHSDCVGCATGQCGSCGCH